MQSDTSNSWRGCARDAPQVRRRPAATLAEAEAEARKAVSRDVNMLVSIKSSGIPDAVKREVLRALLERFQDVRVELDVDNG